MKGGNLGGDKNREKDIKNIGYRCQNELLYYEFGLGVITMPNGKAIIL